MQPKVHQIAAQYLLPCHCILHWQSVTSTYSPTYPSRALDVALAANTAYHPIHHPLRLLTLGVSHSGSTAALDPEPSSAMGLASMISGHSVLYCRQKKRTELHNRCVFTLTTSHQLHHVGCFSRRQYHLFYYRLRQASLSDSIEKRQR